MLTDDQISAESRLFIPALNKSNSPRASSLKVKPGPKPQRASQVPKTFRAPVKRSIKTHSSEEKLQVLEYWKYGQVADEKHGIEIQRPVTLDEVSLRYKVGRKAISFSSVKSCF